MKDFVIVDGELKQYIGFDVEVTIPSGVTSIGKFAFTLTSVTSITIPETAQKIGDYAFCDCLKLVSITIPKETLTIGIGAFFGCRGLADGQGFVIVRDCLYDYLGTAQVLVLPDYITTISDRAFYRCNTLTAVEIPNGVQHVGVAAFLRCKNLKTVKLPGSITEIQSLAFSQCPVLTILSHPNSYAYHYAIANNIPFAKL